MRWLFCLLLTGCVVEFHDYPVAEDGGRELVPGDGRSVGRDDELVVFAGALRCEDRFLRFSGAEGSYVEFPGVPSLEAPFTVEFWSRVGPGDSIDVTHVGPEDPCGWGVRVGYGEVSAGITAAFGHYSQPAESSEWRHVAWTYDGTESVIFVDGRIAGRKEAVAPVGLPGHCSGPMTIGAVLDGAGVPYAWGTGEIDEVRTSRGIVYVDAFEPQRQLEILPGTVGLWHLDDVSAEVGPAGRILGDVARACD